MSIFDKIMDKIFNRNEAKAATPGAPVAPSVTAPSETTAGQAPGTQAQPAAPSNADVGAVLAEMASMKGGGGNYQSSIVDLLKLLDLDSSMDARKELAGELGVHAGDHGSAEQKYRSPQGCDG